MTVATSQTSGFEVVLRGTRLRNFARTYRAPKLGSHWKPLRVFCDWTAISKQAKRDLYVVMCRSTLLDDTELQKARESHTGGEKRFLVLPDESAPESIWERFLSLNVRSPRRFHLPRLDVDDLSTFLSRFLAALALSPSKQMIADAWWEEDRLVVFSPTFERLRVPVGSIPKLRNAPLRDRAEFEIDGHGEFIYWPSHDVHMGWPQFEQAVDPRARIRSRQRSEVFNKKYGQAIRAMRKEAGLRQSAIPSLDERTVRRIEQGHTRATVNALAKLAAAHGLNANEYMSALADRLPAASDR